MFKRQILISFLILCLIISCAPYKMKAIRAKRDNNYERAIQYGLRHLQGNPNDQATLRILEESAKHYFQATKQQIAHYQKIEEWGKVQYAAQTSHDLLSQLISVVGIQFPTKAELDYLATIADQSNIKKAEELYVEGLRYFKDGDFADALEKFEEAQKFVRHYKDTDDYLVKTKYSLAGAEYQNAMNFIRQQEYEQALEKLESVAQYAPNFQGVNEQISNTRDLLAQRYFQQAESFSQAGKLKNAYDLLGKVLSYQPDNSEAQEKYNELREKLTVRLAVFPFETKKLTSDFGDIATQQITAELMKRKSEFFMLLDRQHLQKIFEEQALSQTGVIDEKTAVEVGKMSGVNAIVVGSVSLISSGIAKPTSTTKTGYYEESYLDPRKVKRTKKIPFNYTVYQKQSNVEVNISYQIISVETGEILENKSDNQQQSDIASWIVCPADRVKDLPGSDRDKVGAAKEPQSPKSLINKAIDELSNDAANFIASKFMYGG